MVLPGIVDRPYWLLYQAHSRVQYLVNEAFALEDLKGYHFRVMAAIDHLGPTSQNDIARNTYLDAGRLAHAINELSERGYVRRKPDTTDRRRNIVSITPKGVEVLRRMEAKVDEIEADFLSAFKPDEQKALLRYLTKLSQYVPARFAWRFPAPR